MGSFGDRMKELRKSKNLRQIDLATNLNISQTTIANYENNSRFPNEMTLISLADFFDVSLDYLLGRTDINLNNNRSIDYLNIKFSESNISIESLIEQYIDFLLKERKHAALRLVLNAVNQGMSIEDIYIHVFEKSLTKIGELWESNTINVGQEHYFSEATQLIMSQLYPYVINTNKKDKRIVSLAVNGEFHSIGVKMVNDLLEKDGWSTYYLGVNVPSESIIKIVESQQANILAISATMGFNVNSVETLIKTIHSYDNCKNTKILVGGSAFNKDPYLWKKVNADGYARNALESVSVANQLVNR